MKNFLLYVLITALLAGIPYAIWGQSNEPAQLDSCYSGSWYDPLDPGEGINVEVLDGYYVVYFYTYNADGQTWYVFQGDDNEALTAVDVLDREPVDIGSGSFTPTSTNDAYFIWRFSLDLDKLSPTTPIPWCLHSGCEGEVAYKRLTQPIPCE